MARCPACFGIVTKEESECYVCGEPIPEALKPSWLKRIFWPKPAPRPQKPVKVKKQRPQPTAVRS